MKGRVIVGLLALTVLVATSAAWAGDGYNYFQFAYGNPPNDTLSDAIIRGAHAGSDLDGDGKYEIIVTDYSPCGVHVYEVVADDSIEWVWSSATPYGVSYVRQVHTGDMDNDGIGEIIFAATDGASPSDPLYEGGIHVYEWDGLTDNGYPDSATSIYKPHPTHTGYFRTEDFAIGDIDGDGQNEMVCPHNTTPDDQDGLYILSVTGTFESGFAVWNEEAEFLRSGANPFGGSPTAGAVGDMDGDGNKEAIFDVWDYGALYIVEATDTNTYAYQTYIQCDTTGDGVPLDNIVTADLNNDGADEVYMNFYGGGEIACVTGGADVSTITFANNVTYIAQTGEAGAYGIGIGDQDHGAGTDGADLYTSYYGSGRVIDHEFTGSDPTDPDHWDRHILFEDPGGNFGGSFGIAVPPVDMDGDGDLEVVVTFLESTPPVGKWFAVFEWAGEEVPAHDLGVVEISPTYTITTKNSIAATIKNFGENAESNFEVYWETDTGDSSSETYSGTLASLQSDDVVLGWIPPSTPGMVRMTVWVDLAGDTIATNDTLSQNIFVYPPETTEYSLAYSTRDTADNRCLGLFGNDDYAVGVKSPPFRIVFYHNAPSPPDTFDDVWNDVDTSIAIGYNWGVGIDADSNVYLCNQSIDVSGDSTAQALVWDYNGNEVNFLNLGYSDKAEDDEPDWQELLAMSQRKDLKGTTYPTALDLDDNGNVYVAWYIEDGTIHDQIEVYPPMASWVNHQATKLTGFEPGAFVVEGLCVNGDGSVLWVTDRSAPGYAGDVTRWTGTPAGGYTQDMTFAGDGELELPGFVRGIDVAPDGDIFVLSDDGLPESFAGDKLFIANGTTGELAVTVDIDSPVGDHNDPYDVEVTISAALSVTAQKSADDVFLSWSPPHATAFYIANRYGNYVDKWSLGGAKALAYNVYRDTVADFTPGAGNLLATTSNSYHLDVGATGNTSVNYYYIVEGTGTFGTTDPSTTVGEYDRGLMSAKKKAAPERSVIRLRSRPVSVEEKAPPESRKNR